MSLDKYMIRNISLDFRLMEKYREPRVEFIRRTHTQAHE